MRIKPTYHISSIRVAILLIALFSFSATYVQADADSAAQSIHVEWDYDDSQGMPHTGFHLYQSGNIICSTDTSTDRAMDCTFDSPYGSFFFYLTAYSANAESPLSPPFPFTLKQPPPPPLSAAINANLTQGDIPLAISFDAGDSTGEIETYTWSFGDDTPNTINSLSTAAHTYYSVGIYTASVTVTDAQQQTKTETIQITVTDSTNLPPESPSDPTAVITLSGTSGSAPLKVSFDGSMSQQGNEPIKTFLWNFDDNSPQATGPIQNHTFSAPGTYHPTLTVSDGKGASDTASTTIVVRHSTTIITAPAARMPAALQATYLLLLNSPSPPSDT